MILQAKMAEFGPEQSDAEIVAALNAPDISLPLRRADMATADLREKLLRTGEWAAVVLAATDAEPEARKAAITLRDTINDTAMIRASEPAIYAATHSLLSGLVAAGVLTGATKDALMALADRPQSWAAANGVDVTVRSVALARGAK